MNGLSKKVDYPQRASLSYEESARQNTPADDPSLISSDASVPQVPRRKKLQLLAGLISALPHDPDLAAIFQDQLVAPRTAQMRDLFDRAVARGEIAGGRNLDTLALVAPAMTVHRLMIMNKPLDRAFRSSSRRGPSPNGHRETTVPCDAQSAPL